MTGARADIWRQRLWVWATALAFLVVNCVGLLVYQLGYSDRVKTLQVDLHDQGARLAEAHAERQQLEGQLRQVRINRERILQLYDEHFSTRRRRLTGVTAEVKDLAKRAGLVPRSIAYPEEQIQQYGLIKRSFVFTVEGTYADLRKFINLLELSDSFLTLEEASLSEEAARHPGGSPQPSMSARSTVPGLAVPGAALAGAALPAPPAAGGAGGLRMSLTISTLFATKDEPQDVLAPLPGANAGSAAGAPRGRTP
jgi:type IV pilus assembly protein PilO